MNAYDNTDEKKTVILLTRLGVVIFSSQSLSEEDAADSTFTKVGATLSVKSKWASCDNGYKYGYWTALKPDQVVDLLNTHWDSATFTRSVETAAPAPVQCAAYHYGKHAQNLMGPDGRMPTIEEYTQIGLDLIRSPEGRENQEYRRYARERLTASAQKWDVTTSQQRRTKHDVYYTHNGKHFAIFKTDGATLKLISVGKCIPLSPAISIPGS